MFIPMLLSNVSLRNSLDVTYLKLTNNQTDDNCHSVKGLCPSGEDRKRSEISGFS